MKKVLSSLLLVSLMFNTAQAGVNDIKGLKKNIVLEHLENGEISIKYCDETNGRECDQLGPKSSYSKAELSEIVSTSKRHFAEGAAKTALTAGTGLALGFFLGLVAPIATAGAVAVGGTTLVAGAASGLAIGTTLGLTGNNGAIAKYREMRTFDHDFVSDIDVEMSDEDVAKAAIIIDKLLEEGPESTWDQIKRNVGGVFEYLGNVLYDWLN